MDFQGFVNTFSLACAVLSVQEQSNNHCGEIRIVKANDIYREKMGVARYHDGMLYDELVPKDSKFEDFCYRSAIKKQKMHAYVKSSGINCWSDITFLPLSCSDSGLSYCAFFLETTLEPEADRLANVSFETAKQVLKASISLKNSKTLVEGISKVVSDIQEQSEATCCCILTLDKNRKTYSVLYEKLKAPKQTFMEASQNLSYDIIESWEKTLGKSNGIIIKDEVDMAEIEKENAPWVYTLRKDKIESIMLFPLHKSGEISGYIFITNFNTNKVVELKELLELMSYFVSVEISNQGIISNLETISTMDILTDVKNRSAMNLRVDNFVKGTEGIVAPFGVIFADVNGLEQVNEDSGHSYGDVLLKKAAELIKELFKKDEIYRSNGDEFVIIVPDCQKEDFDEKVNELKARSRYGSPVCLSVGSHWNEEGKKIRRSMHLADEEMYNEKARFYMEHQNLERRRR